MGGTGGTTHRSVMPTNIAPAALDQAEIVLASVAAMYAQEIEAGLYPAPLLATGRNAAGYGSDFAVVWEEGPFEWAFRLDGQPDEDLFNLAVDAGLCRDQARRLASTRSLFVPDGVEVDPYSSYILCISVYETA